MLFREQANNAKEFNGRIALLFKSQTNVYNIVKLVLRHLTHPNFEGKDGKMALMYTSICGNYQIVGLLPKEKTDRY